MLGACEPDFLMSASSGSGSLPPSGEYPTPSGTFASICLPTRRWHLIGVLPPAPVFDATERIGVVFHRSMDASITSDADLVDRLADDLDGSFEMLVDMHAGRLFSIALRVIGDRSDAEDAAQDALVRAYRALEGYDAQRIREIRLRPWLATIVLNVCRNRTRVKRVATVELAFEPAAEPIVDPLARRDARAVWASLLGTLPPAQRTAIVLRHVDGLSYAEMAEALGRPEGTLKAQVHRGLGALREAFIAAERQEREEVIA